jgi:hypothetical protein
MKTLRRTPPRCPSCTSYGKRVVPTKQRSHEARGPFRLKEERTQHAETSQKHFHSQLGFDHEIIPRVDLPRSALPRSKKRRTANTRSSRSPAFSAPKPRTLGLAG